MLYPTHYGENPLFPNKDDFEIVHKNSGVGMGVISYRGFKKGELVAVMAGEIIHDIRQHSLQISETDHLYDIYFSGYFLHSCNPNISLDMKNLRVYAVRDIKPNDYLYMDYAETEEKLFKQFPCGCGSKQCRGWVTGYNQLPDEEDPAYIEFLSRQSIAV
jgi:SET domain-containing protein